MSSRKVRLKKGSPFKGSGRFLQYIRCPACGKLGRAQAIGNAGVHKLSVSQCTGPKGGYRAGFNWEHKAPNREQLEGLAEALRRALSQVERELGVGPALVLAEFEPIRSGKFQVMTSRTHIEGDEKHGIQEERVRVPMRVDLLRG